MEKRKRTKIHMGDQQMGSKNRGDKTRVAITADSDKWQGPTGVGAIDASG